MHNACFENYISAKIHIILIAIISSLWHFCLESSNFSKSVSYIFYTKREREIGGEIYIDIGIRLRGNKIELCRIVVLPL